MLATPPTTAQVVLKPSELTPLTALAMAELGERAGIPLGVLNVVVGDAKSIGDELIKSDEVRKIAFTGSTRIGKLLMAGAASTVKKVSMELGGNAPYIVFPDAGGLRWRGGGRGGFNCDAVCKRMASGATRSLIPNHADLKAAASQAAASSHRNAGQTCICTNRVLVHVRGDRLGGLLLLLDASTVSLVPFSSVLMPLRTAAPAPTRPPHRRQPCAGKRARRVCQGAGGGGPGIQAGPRHRPQHHPRPAHPAGGRRQGERVALTSEQN